ncbi:hypothetical protein, partial [Enterobacter cloacae]|uniref:hypothetical protein n=1 Tax=Enterobacter cloacae TaxID=550 RepID=UPI003BEEDF94
RISKLKTVTDKSVFSSIESEIPFPHPSIRIATTQDARVIVVSANKMEINEACRRGLFRSNFEASEVGCDAIS